MDSTQWLIFFLVLQVIHGLATWKLYIKAGRQAWEAFIPVYNAVILMKIINREWWWTILLFLPIVNLILFPVVWVETARSFGKNSNMDTFLAIISLGFYNFYLNYVAEVSYIEDRDLHPKSEVGDWVSSILFAVVAATIVHTYFIQPFVIPSSSLEKSLLVGDFLFVSKFHYGARVPMTTVGLPMVHDSIPKTAMKSYLFNDDFTKKNSSWINKLQLPYMRIPGFEEIDRNEIVVFNQPADTLLNMDDFHPDRNYYKPIDKKTNLVKRCVGIPGDSLEIRNGYVFINGVQNELPDRAELQFFHTLIVKSDINTTLNSYGIREFRRLYAIQNTYWDDDKLQDYLRTNEMVFNVISRDSTKTVFTDGGTMTQDFYNRLRIESVRNTINANMTEALAAQLKADPNVVSIEKFSTKTSDPKLFPHDAEYAFAVDNFGPIFIPGSGKTVALNIDVLPLYKRAIMEYEGQKLQVKGNQIFINDVLATEYTFQKDYYWMMGDNRQNSIDSRYWGFVPYDHVVGKPVLIWMSWDSNASGFNKIRWNRLFSTVHGSGKRVSYFIPFLLFLGGWIGFNKYRKRKKA